MPVTANWAIDLVERTWAKWSDIDGSAEDLSEFKAMGFAVFYSPVRQTTSLLILGLNPGGGARDFQETNARRVPDTHEYLHENYPIARATRSLFDRIGQAELLKSSVKSNLQFFRTPTMSKWRKLPSPLRNQLTEFCDSAVHKMVDELQPRFILLEGISTFDRFMASNRQGMPDKTINPTGKRRIYTSTMMGQIRVIGILHLSGARPSLKDVDLIAEALKEDLTR